MTEAVAEKRAVPIIATNRVREGQYEFNTWVANADEATTQSDVLKGEFWAHVAPQFRPWDIIHVRADDESWYSQLLVRQVEAGYVRVEPLHQWKFGEQDMTALAAATALRAAYAPKWGGPQMKWTVVRRSDSERVATGLTSEKEAITWIDERMKADRATG